ncbi:MAG: GMC family oxidoreductase [Deltaproteobacteria bacterium]|nr:GMC family oxidoreductase [Deltaproteobacteria bacterium]
MHIVIGSGPAGIAAAKSLLAAGHEVTMLDVGYTLEPDRQEKVDQLARGDRKSWDKRVLEEITKATEPDVKGLPKKLIFGSDYPFKNPAEHIEIEAKGVDVLMSHAAGGLSNVWGANLMPLHERDIAGWPLTLKELEPYYKKVLEFVQLSAVVDRLHDHFPILTDGALPLKLSKQAQSFLKDLEASKKALERQGIFFGSSRLAVRASSLEGDGGCTYCGMCLYGCPYSLIYSSAHTLKQLSDEPRFKYVPNVFVERVEESGDSAKVTGRDLNTGGQSSFAAERVFIAAGAVSSTRIVLESLEAYEKELAIKDSQYFLLPFLRFKGSGDVTKEQLHTLSQVALNIHREDISSKPIHVLTYTYNDLYLRAIKKLLGPLFSLSKPVINPLLSRLVVLQGYLNSNESPEILLKVSRPQNGRRAVSLEAKLNPLTKGAIKKLMKLMRTNTFRLGGIGLRPLMHVGAPGKSYHIGASLPMREAPGEFESDILGRPHGLKRVHVVDTAVFTDVPATNVTFTIMANAYRIAAEASA